MNLTDQQMIDFVESRLTRLFTSKEFDVPHKRRIYLGDMPDMESYLRSKDKIAQDRSRGQFPPCMLPCFKEPLLTRAQELHQLRKYNLLKYAAKEKLEAAQLRYAYCFMQRAIEVGNQVAEANFRLAASVVRKKCGMENEDKFSLAYMDVMKSVDYFDWTRGFKFSTYTTWLIQRTIIRNWQIEQRDRERGFFFLDTDIMAEHFECEGTGHDQERQYEADKRTVAYLLAHCGPPKCKPEDLERRQFIIMHRFGLGDKPNMTLEEIGQILKISKERVRQIEKSSMEYIQAHLEERREKRKVA